MELAKLERKENKLMSAVTPIYHTFSVYGIHCSQCLKKLKALPDEVPGLDDVVIDMSQQQVKVAAKDDFKSQDFIVATQKLGFEAKEIHLDGNLASAAEKSRKALLSKLGVAGFLTGNIMLLSYSVYLGAPDKFKSLFMNISAVLYLPVLLYSAQIFYKSSWSALKRGRPSIDLPLTLAIILGSSLSYFNLFRASENIYFDSLAALVFLILSSRYIVQGFQNKYLTPISLQDIFPSQTYIKIENNMQVPVEVRDLDKGVELLLSEGQVVPVDCKLLSDEVIIDNSLMTGESQPVVLEKASTVFAGAKILSMSAHLESLTTKDKSRISQILDKLDIALNRDSSIVDYTDSFANFFTYGVFGVGLLFFVFYAFIDFNESVNRVLSLFVIACPCALAITTPIVLRLSARHALKKNFLVKETDVFEKISRCEAVVFDKTGTLTFNSSEVLSWSPKKPTGKDLDILYALENLSSHPIALAIIQSLNLKMATRDIQLTNYKEIPGFGVEAFVEGVKYSVHRSEIDQGSLGFFREGQQLYSLKVQGSVRPEVKAEINKLKSMDIDIYLLTGDSGANAIRVAEEVGIPRKNVFFNISPEEKDQHIADISSQHKLVYVGDGLNDSLAMTRGLVGISMNQSVEATFAASSVHILKDGLVGLSGLFVQSRRSISIVKSLLLMSFIYNSVFGVLALSGYISPLVAAILMPISSLALLGFGAIATQRSNL